MDAKEVYLVKPPPSDIEAQLLRPINAVVGTLNPDGSIHLAFVIFLWENGKFYFETASITKKVRNIRANPTASFAIDPPGFMAMAEGSARIIEGEEALEINRRLRGKNLTPEAAGSVGKAWGEFDDVAVEITPKELAVVVERKTGPGEQRGRRRPDPRQMVRPRIEPDNSSVSISRPYAAENRHRAA